jgi:hypothetical protein
MRLTPEQIENEKRMLTSNGLKTFSIPYDQDNKEDPLDRHVGSSNYSKKKIQPWHIWDEYELNPWDADIIKRILRTKEVKGQSPLETRKEDYQKVIHICEFLIFRLEKKRDDE